MTIDKVDVKTKEITKLRNQIKDIFSEYMRRISDNKFHNFLCRILRKKYKEVKEDDGNKSILRRIVSNCLNLK